MNDQERLLSIIIPLYNEEVALPELFRRLNLCLVELPCKYELIFVDNCSEDASGSLITMRASEDARIKYIKFSRNFGPSVEASLAAGYSQSKGDAAIVLYSDLQDPPELIPEFVRLWLEGFDVVYGIQLRRKGEPLWRRLAVRMFYKIMTVLSDVPIVPNSGDFRLVSRRVIDVLNAFPERTRYNRGLISWVGYPSIGIPYSRDPRNSGKSQAGFFAIVRTAFTAITAFSVKPLRLLTGIGITISFFSLLMTFGLILQWLIGNPLPGLTTVMVLILLSLGINMAAIGIVGEYIGRIQLEVKRRPLYVIDTTVNI